MESLERLLAEHSFLEGLNPDQVKFLTGCARNVRFEAGEFLMREGADADALYLVRRGKVHLEINIPGEGVQRVETLGPRDILGWSWLFPPFKWQLDARAAEASMALALDAVCLRKKMDADHTLGYSLCKRLLQHSHGRLERVRMQRLDLYTSGAR